ncbi:MAG TPA: SDR family oxidoreductase, partial [Castellaniella sp.]|nr:SDR family oxidoreductase [Castellaniella sp.]
MVSISGRVALVTGAAGGIGFALAHSLAQNGASVALCDVNESALATATERLAEFGPRVVAVILDVADPTAWEKTADHIESRLGPVSILCNNAGVGAPRAPVADTSFVDWRWTLGINLDGVFLGCRTLLPRMIAQGQGGQVVNTASILGHFAKPFHAAYVASKCAVVGLSETLRLELAPHGIGVSVLCPGLVRTRLRSNSASLRGNTSKPLRDARPEGLDPMLLGPMAIEAIRENRLHILPHHEYRAAVAHRMQGLLDSFVPRADEGYHEDPAYLSANSLR